MRAVHDGVAFSGRDQRQSSNLALGGPESHDPSRPGVRSAKQPTNPTASRGLLRFRGHCAHPSTCCRPASFVNDPELTSDRLDLCQKFACAGVGVTGQYFEMKRREFIARDGAAVTTPPLAAARA